MPCPRCDLISFGGGGGAGWQIDAYGGLRVTSAGGGSGSGCQLNEQSQGGGCGGGLALGAAHRGCDSDNVQDTFSTGDLRRSIRRCTRAGGSMRLVGGGGASLACLQVSLTWEDSPEHWQQRQYHDQRVAQRLHAHIARGVRDTIRHWLSSESSQSSLADAVQEYLASTVPHDEPQAASTMAATRGVYLSTDAIDCSLIRACARIAKMSQL